MGAEFRGLIEKIRPMRAGRGIRTQREHAFSFLSIQEIGVGNLDSTRAGSSRH